MPGVSGGCYLSTACNGAVVAEVYYRLFGQRLAELITYQCEYKILVYLKYRLFAYRIASLLCGIRELPFVFPVVGRLVTLL